MIYTTSPNRAKITSWLLIGIILFCFIYSFLAFWYLAHDKVSSSSKTVNHAKIISHDLWNLNQSGMRAYLHLVANTDHYKYIKILTEDESEFIYIEGPSIPSLDIFFLQMGLIYSKNISHPIEYKKDRIGTLQGEQYVRHIYPLALIFMLQFFAILTIVFVTYLLRNRQLLESQVRERTKKYHELVNLLPEMVLETDGSGRITFANQKAIERFGLSDFSSTSYNYRDFIYQKSGTMDHSFFLRATEDELEKKEFRARGKQGNLFPVLIRSAPIAHSDNRDSEKLLGSRFVIVDITERNALLEQLNQDQKMKSIGLMAGGVAHDLNNILSGIINYPELMMQHIPEGSPLLRFVPPMKDAGLRAAAVVADLLTVARGIAAPRQTTDLNDIVEEYLHSPEFFDVKSMYPDIQYKKQLDTNACSISCSVIHLKKCLMNLVINGSEAVTGQGDITISTSSRTINNTITHHGSIQAGTYLVLSVQDSGAGISPDALPHIFEPFYSKKELGRSGTGLGLAVVWNTMQDHNGSVQVESDFNGTKFSLYFPCSPEDQQRENTPVDRTMERGDGKSILVVDDEPQQRDIAVQLLASLGYNVDAVLSGEEAITYFNSHKPDLVLLDMVMGAGMNGRQTYEKIITLSPNQKAIIMSGFSASSDVQEAIRLGAGGLINKPYTKEQLSKEVHRVLAG